MRGGRSSWGGKKQRAEIVHKESGEKKAKKMNSQVEPNNEGGVPIHHQGTGYWGKSGNK